MISFSPNNDLKADPIIFHIKFDNLVVLGIIAVISIMAYGILCDDLHFPLQIPIMAVSVVLVLGGYIGFRIIEQKYEPTWLNKYLASFQSPKKVRGIYLKDKILKS